MSESRQSEWPELAGDGSWETARTLHLWTQIIGKTRLALAPMVNHWWQVPLYLTARGLSTSPIPTPAGSFDVELDLLSHRVELRASDGSHEGFSLEQQRTLADFYQRFFTALRQMGVEVSIHPLAVEIPETIFLDRDSTVRPYDFRWATRFFEALISVDQVLKAFAGAFLGKVSPVHFFWGSFDMAVTRFSGRRAPLHPGGAPHVADSVMQEAYSHELSSAGFWPGLPGVCEPIFYSYAYPEPQGFAQSRVSPASARYDAGLREFILPYEAVRSSASPARAVRNFLETTYVAAAELGGWNRAELERPRIERPLSVEETHGLRM